MKIHPFIQLLPSTLPLALAAVFVLPALTPSAHATAIPVDNYSFELPDQGHDTSTVQRFASTVASWFCVGSGSTGYGVDDPSNTQYSGTDGPVLPGTADGAQFAFMNLPDGFSNTFTYAGSSLGNFVAGETYTLTVALGGRRGTGLPANSFGISLLASGAPVGTGASAPGVADTFFDVSYSFTATALEDGLPIGIRFDASNTGGGFRQANFDNVRLATTAVPEPATFSLLALGTGFIAARRRNAQA